VFRVEGSALQRWIAATAGVERADGLFVQPAADIGLSNAVWLRFLHIGNPAVTIVNAYKNARICSGLD
jgi:hypothetical protein